MILFLAFFSFSVLRSLSMLANCALSISFFAHSCTSCAGLLGCCVLSFVRHQHRAVTLSKWIFVRITHLRTGFLFDFFSFFTHPSLAALSHSPYMVRLSVVNALLWHVSGRSPSPLRLDVCSIENGRWYPRSDVLLLGGRVVHVGDTCLCTTKWFHWTFHYYYYFFRFFSHTLFSFTPTPTRKSVWWQERKWKI